MTNLCRESFVMYRSHIDAINDIQNDTERLAIYDAIFQFALDGKEIELNGISKTIFTLIKPQIVANNRKRDKGIKNGRKGAASGTLGGRPKNPQKTPNETPKKPPSEPLKNPQGVIKQNPQKPPNVNENVNVNVNGNVNVINKSSKDNLLKKEKVKKKIQDEKTKLPEWLNENLWKDYLEMRKKIRKPATEYAQKLILNKLEGFENGNIGDGTLALEISIERSYQGVFEPRGEDRAKNNQIRVVNKGPKDLKKEAQQELDHIVMRCQNLRNEVSDDYVSDLTYRDIIKDFGGAFEFAEFVRSSDNNQKKEVYGGLINQYLETKFQNETLGEKDVDLGKLSVNNC